MSGLVSKQSYKDAGHTISTGNITVDKPIVVVREDTKLVSSVAEAAAETASLFEDLAPDVVEAFANVAMLAKRVEQKNVYYTFVTQTLSVLLLLLAAQRTADGRVELRFVQVKASVTAFAFDTITHHHELKKKRFGHVVSTQRWTTTEQKPRGFSPAEISHVHNCLLDAIDNNASAHQFATATEL